MLTKIINWLFPPNWKFLTEVDMPTAFTIFSLLSEYKGIVNRRLRYKILGNKVYVDVNYKGKNKMNETILQLLKIEE